MTSLTTSDYSPSATRTKEVNNDYSRTKAMDCKVRPESESDNTSGRDVLTSLTSGHKQPDRLYRLADKVPLIRSKSNGPLTLVIKSIFTINTIWL